MNEKTRLIKWVKALAVFLCIMWVCTIVSRSIYVSKLTKVECEMPTEKFIEHKIESEGIIKAGSQKAVTVTSGLRVWQIYVREGDWVNKGDLLFDIDMADLDKIIAEKETALTSKQYQLADVQFNTILSEQKREVEYLWAKEDYESAIKETSEKIERASQELSLASRKLNEHINTTVPYTSDNDRKNAWDKYNNYKNAYYEAVDRVSELEEKIAELEHQISEITEENEDKLETLKEELAGTKEELDKARQILTEYERNPVSQPDYSAEESEYDAWQSTKSSLEDAVRTAQYNLNDIRTSAENTLRNQLRNTASAQALAPLDSTAYIYELEIASIQSELQDYYKIKNNKGCVNAQSDGYVLDMSVSVGGRTTDTSALTLSNDDKPCYVEFNINKEQSKYIQLGDMVEIKLNDTRAAKEKTETKVTHLSQNQQGDYQMSCELPNEIGQPNISTTVTKTVKGELQKLCIPINALYEENNAYYIYILEENEVIIGKEYCARKVKVNVIDKNEKFAAIEEGIITKDTQVITYSSKELKQGESVRQ